MVLFAKNILRLFSDDFLMIFWLFWTESDTNIIKAPPGVWILEYLDKS